jgi:hypothetical protein
MEVKEEKYSYVQGKKEITIVEQMVKYHKSSNSTRACTCAFAATRIDTNGQL